MSPCRLASCSTGCGAPRNFLYERYFVRCIRNALPAVHTLHGWHEAVVAPARGYRDAAEYYRRASALGVVGQIRVPTLIVTAQDDPFIPFEPFLRPRHLQKPVHPAHCPRARWALCLYFKHWRPGAILGCELDDDCRCKSRRLSHRC